jgi:hypothetical protein
MVIQAQPGDLYLRSDGVIVAYKRRFFNVLANRERMTWVVANAEGNGLYFTDTDGSNGRNNTSIVGLATYTECPW